MNMTFEKESTSYQRQDWTQVPHLSVFYGRSQELDTLKQWIVEEKNRLVAIVGTAGIGKTALAAKVARDVGNEFDCIIWRNLRHVRSFHRLLTELIEFFGDRKTTIPISIPEFISYLQASRCLIILDDWQLIMQNEDEYKNYCQLLNAVAEESHQSVVAIATSKQLDRMHLLENNLVRCLQLEGLGESAKEIFQAKGISDEHLWQKLIKIYRGNPQELESIATTIKNVFAGSVIEFFDQETFLGIIDENSNNNFDEQFKYLSELERYLLQILLDSKQALNREQLQHALNSLSIKTFHSRVTASQLTKGLESLLARSLVKITTKQGRLLFSFESMAIEYATRKYLSQNNFLGKDSKILKDKKPEETLNSKPNPTSPIVSSQITAVENDRDILARSGKGRTSAIETSYQQQQSLSQLQISTQQNSNRDSSLPTAQPQTQTNALSLPIVRENDFLPPIGFWGRVGGLLIVGAVGITIVLCAIIPYKTTVKARAKVRPAGEVKIVEAKTEGTIVDIPVKGDRVVKKGDTIAIIDNSRLQTQKIQLEGNIQKADSQLQQIKAQLVAQNNQVLAETNRVQRSIASAAAELRRSSREFQNKKSTSSAEVEEAVANLRSTEQESQQAQTELQSIEAQLKASESELKAAESKYHRYQIIAETGALSQDQIEEARLASEQKQQQLESHKAAVLKQRQGIIKQQEAVRAAMARLENVRVALNPSDAEVAIAQQQIEREQASGQVSLAVLRREREALIQQQIEIRQQHSHARQELQQVENDLARTKIIAPADGVVFQINLRNPGQTVSQGKEIARIAPEGTAFAIDSMVPADDISKVKVGQKAQMRVSACPYPDYGTLKGVVRQISPDAITSQDNNRPNNSGSNQETNNNTQGKAFYQATIEPESIFLGQQEHRCFLQLGMEARADIISQEETVLKFILRKVRLIADF
jgi:multidrug efflux pump subunit AcrA (membrane-fusion protein)/AAA+ ATPase superfamily predicted ATPase